MIGAAAPGASSSHDGFWLACWLGVVKSVETEVLDSASDLVNRKARQRKSERMAAQKDRA